MNKVLETALDSHIVLYWWNMGKKSKDHDGTYKDFFKRIGVKIKQTDKGLKINFSTNQIKYNIISTDYDIIETFNQIVKIYLTYLGDKALMIDTFNRESKINWR